MSLGDTKCGICGMWNPPNMHTCGGTPWEGPLYGRYQFTPYSPLPPDCTYLPAAPLTAEDVRRIVREELERAADREREINNVG